MERYEKPYMEVIDIEDELTTTLRGLPCNFDTSLECPYDGQCLGDISIGHS